MQCGCVCLCVVCEVYVVSLCPRLIVDDDSLYMFEIRHKVKTLNN